MATDTFQQEAHDYKRIADAIDFAEENFRSQPSLDEMARHVHLSKYHFQRLFKRWAGVSPSQFVQYLTLEYAKQHLFLHVTGIAALGSPARVMVDEWVVASVMKGIIVVLIFACHGDTGRDGLLINL